MRGRVIGATLSHTQAVQFVNKTAPRQQPPSQPRSTRNASNCTISHPGNEVSTPSNKPKMTFHIKQTASRSAAETPDENQSSEQPQPASTGPASTVSAAEASTSTTSANDPSYLSQHHNGQSQRSAQPQPEPQQKSLDTTNHNKDKSVKKWTFQLNKFPAPKPKNLPQGLLFLADSNTNVIFLVDSGSEISILPKELTNGIDKYFPKQSRTIQGFGNKTTHPIGSADVELQLGNLEPINHSFWVTQESRHFGIIGMDLLRKNELAILPSTSQLCKMGSNESARLFAPAELPTPIVASVNHINLGGKNTTPLEEKCKRLLMDFPEITRKPTYHAKPKHNYELEIILDNYKPAMVKARRPGVFLYKHRKIFGTF